VAKPVPKLSIQVVKKKAGNEGSGNIKKIMYDHKNTTESLEGGENIETTGSAAERSSQYRGVDDSFVIRG